jgi:small subunit ribosomal protein S4
MKVGPRYKIAKRLGSAVFEKTQGQKFARSEERSKMNKMKKKPKGLSDYGKQFLEKQKVRFTYGITEKQLKNYVDKALLAKDSPTDLYHALEMRADNASCRLGLAPTRRAARQMVAHGNVTVNGTRITIPSYALKAGDVIAPRASRKETALFANVTLQGSPAWITADIITKSGTLTGTPIYKADESHFNLSQVFEFYSR